MPNNTVKPDADTIVVYDADARLREKVGGPGALGKLFTLDRIQKSQRVIDDFKAGFFGELGNHLHTLRQACDGPVEIDPVRASARALKSQAESLGFDLLFALSEGLYQYLEDKKGPLTSEQQLVVIKHAESLILTLERQERGKGGVTEQELLQTLGLLRRKYP
jgi:hypothetical protein